MFEALGLAQALDYLGEAAFEGELYDLGEYPGAVPGEGSVRGELYRIKDPAIFQALDDYEEFEPDHPERSLFVRRRVPVRGVGEAWVYFYNGSRENRRRIDSGEWRNSRPAA